MESHKNVPNHQPAIVKTPKHDGQDNKLNKHMKNWVLAASAQVVKVCWMMVNHINSYSNIINQAMKSTNVVLVTVYKSIEQIRYFDGDIAMKSLIKQLQLKPFTTHKWLTMSIYVYKWRYHSNGDHWLETGKRAISVRSASFRSKAHIQTHVGIAHNTSKVHPVSANQTCLGEEKSPIPTVPLANFTRQNTKELFLCTYTSTYT